MDEVVENHEMDQQEMDEFKHAKMLEMLAGKKRGPTKNRTEAGTTVSEFYVGTVDTAKVAVGDLLSSIKRSVKLSTISRQVEKKFKLDKAKILPSPLSTEDANRVKREVAFSKASKELSKWEKLVLQNRQAEQLKFPLNQISIKRDGLEQLVSKQTNKTPLELEMEALLGECKDPEPDSQEMKRRKMTRLAFQEAMELRRNMSQIRARQSYYEEKARRSKKIKSKAYHRILKKERLKSDVKSFDALSKSNPELAEEKLNELDKKRILERMSLRHKNTGKWAKHMKIRAHHDKETSRAIQDQIDISRTLTEKTFVAPDDDEDDPSANGVLVNDSWPRDAGGPPWVFRGDASNPWMAGRDATKGSAEFGENEVEPEDGTVNYRKYWELENQRRLAANEPPLGSDDPATLMVPSSHLDDIVLKRKVDPQERKESVENKTPFNGKTGSKKLVPKTFLGAEQIEGAVKKTKRKRGDAISSNVKLEKKSEKTVTGKNNLETSVSVSDRKKKNVSFQDNYQTPDTDDVDLIFAKALTTKLSKTNGSMQKTKLKVKKTNKRTQGADDFEAIKDVDLITETASRRNPMEDSDAEPLGPRRGGQTTLGKRVSKSKQRSQAEEKGNVEEEVDIDPNNFITVKTATIKVRVPDAIDHDDDAMDDAEENEDATDNDVTAAEHHRMTLAEAFADDDVVEEFRIMKQAVVEEDTPKAVDRSLPGWGSWGGTGIKMSQRKRIRFTEPAAKADKRLDRKLANVIIHGETNKRLAEQQIKQLPTAFQSPRDFEKYMNAPLGNDWNPVSAYKKLITPRVITKKGAIIEPMNEDALEDDQFNKPTDDAKFDSDSEDD